MALAYTDTIREVAKFIEEPYEFFLRDERTPRQAILDLLNDRSDPDAALVVGVAAVITQNDDAAGHLSRIDFTSVAPDMMDDRWDCLSKAKALLNPEIMSVYELSFARTYYRAAEYVAAFYSSIDEDLMWDLGSSCRHDEFVRTEMLPSSVLYLCELVELRSTLRAVFDSLDGDYKTDGLQRYVYRYDSNRYHHTIAIGYSSLYGGATSGFDDLTNAFFMYRAERGCKELDGRQVEFYNGDDDDVPEDVIALRLLVATSRAVMTSRGVGVMDLLKGLDVREAFAGVTNERTIYRAIDLRRIMVDSDAVNNPVVTVDRYTAVAARILKCVDTLDIIDSPVREPITNMYEEDHRHDELISIGASKPTYEDAIIGMCALLSLPDVTELVRRCRQTKVSGILRLLTPGTTTISQNRPVRFKVPA